MLSVPGMQVSAYVRWSSIATEALNSRSRKCMRVQILLSTYNGATYLKPLMESLLAQDCPEIEILVRDDGSSDNTTNLLFDYATRYQHVKVVYGAHFGFVRSFFRAS